MLNDGDHRQRGERVALQLIERGVFVVHLNLVAISIAP
jgi:hypothetical protein